MFTVLLGLGDEKSISALFAVSFFFLGDETRGRLSVRLDALYSRDLFGPRKNFKGLFSIHFEEDKTSGHLLHLLVNIKTRTS